jgi:thiol-disulfide isomerase/thioredoxin
MRWLLLSALLSSAPALSADGGLPVKAGAPRRSLTEITLLSFQANWCTACQRFEASRVLDRLRERLPGLSVEEVDVDARQDLVDRYGVENTPALVLVDAEGFPLARPKILLDDEAATAAGVEKAVRKMAEVPTSSP